VKFLVEPEISYNHLNILLNDVFVLGDEDRGALRLMSRASYINTFTYYTYLLTYSLTYLLTY